MSKAKLQAAKELIQSRQYEEARALLKTIDHPTAQDWLAKLDRLAPQPRYTRGRLLAFGLFVLLMCALVVFVFYSYTSQFKIPVP